MAMAVLICWTFRCCASTSGSLDPRWCRDHSRTDFCAMMRAVRHARANPSHRVRPLNRKSIHLAAARTASPYPPQEVSSGHDRIRAGPAGCPTDRAQPERFAERIRLEVQTNLVTVEVGKFEADLTVGISCPLGGGPPKKTRWPSITKRSPRAGPVPSPGTALVH